MFHSKAVCTVTSITLNIEDKARMKHFYSDILGFTCVRETETMLQYEVGHSEHYIILKCIPHGRIPSENEAGLYHLAIHVPNISDLADVCIRLMHHATPVGCYEHHVYRAVYLADPEGNGLAFYCDAPKDAWQCDDSGYLNVSNEPLALAHVVSQRSKFGWQGVPDTATIGYIYLKTTQMLTMAPFYEHYFNMYVTRRVAQNILWLTSSSAHHHLALNAWPTRTKRRDNACTYGLAHVEMQHSTAMHTMLVGADGIHFSFKNNGSECKR